MNEIDRNKDATELKDMGKQFNAEVHKIDKQAMLSAIKNKFISTVIKIYINSLEREVSFREITVAE